MAMLGMYALGLAFGVVGLGLVVGQVTAQRAGSSGNAALRGPSRHDSRAALASAVLALLVGVVLVGLDPGRYLPVRMGDPWASQWAAVLGPAISGLGALGILGTHAVGELTWPKPSGAHRQARLRARNVRDVTSVGLRRLPAVWAAGAVAMATVFALVASGPSTITRLITPERAYTVAAFPGWKYGLPLVLVMVIVAVAGEGVLRLVSSRPAVGDVEEEVDMWLRRRTARRVLRVEQFILAVALSGFVGIGGLSVRVLGLERVGAGGVPIPSSPGHVVIGTLLLLVALAILTAGTLVALRGATDPAPTGAAGVDRAAKSAR